MTLFTFFRISRIIGSTLTSAFLCGLVISIYHQCRGEIQKEYTKIKIDLKSSLLKMFSIIFLLVILLFFIETEMGGELLRTFDDVPKIIAPRDGTCNAP